jgi:LPXTG-motif cell wall-anchored protein
MLKKLAIVITIITVMAVFFQTGVFAAVVEIDTKSPEFKVESYQVTESSGEYCYWEYVTETTPTTTAAGVTNADIKRFSTSVKVGAANIIGDPAVTLIDGRASVNPVFPFKNAVKLESFTLKFNNGTRQYFFIPYVSMDGKTWTEVPVSGAAKKVTISTTYGATGALDGPGIDCYATTPAGSAANNDINVITIKLDKPTEAKYLKLTFFGNDGGKDQLAVAHEWVSFNSFTAEGTPVTASNTNNTTSPKTGDNIIILLGASLVSVAAVVAVKKRKA